MEKNKTIQKVRGNNSEKIVTIPRKSEIQIGDYVFIQKLNNLNMSETKT